MPASSRVGENMAQPCALTTRVSQISEKGALGSRLVTAMGRVIGTLELRRMVSGTFALCMLSLFHGIPLSCCALLTCVADLRCKRACRLTCGPAQNSAPL